LYDAANGPLQAANVGPVLTAQYQALQSNGVSAANPSSVSSWINNRRTFILSELSGLTTPAVDFAITSNGGANFSTDVNLVTLTGTAPIQVRSILVNGTPYPVTWTSLTEWELQIALGPGSTQLNLGALGSNGGLLSGLFDSINITYTGPIEDPAEFLLINEIMYNPALPRAEFLEIHNRSSSIAFDLTGYRLDGAGFDFPAGTVIQPGAFLVMVQDLQQYLAVYGPGAVASVVGVMNGRLDNDGETLRLVRLGATPAEDVLIDEVTYDEDPPWPTLANGFGPSLQLIDPAQDNNHVANWAAVEGTGSGSTTNLLSDYDDLWKYHDLAQDLGDAWRQSDYADDSWQEGPGLLAWEDAPLPEPIRTDLTLGATTYYFRRAFNFQGDPGATALRLETIIDDGAVFYLNGTEVFRLGVDEPSPTYNTFASTPGAPNSVRADLAPFPPLWINEVQPVNIDGPTDGNGDQDPWLELYNAGADTISLDGFSLTDTFNTPAKWMFPAGAAIGPGEFRVVWLDAQPGQGTADEWHAGFTIDPDSGSLFLFRQADTQPVVVDFLHYQQIPPDRSYGRFPDGDPGALQSFHFPTPGGPNDNSAPPVTVFINEWMAANTATIADPVAGQFDDWFELYNPGDAPADLSGYSLTDNLADPTKYRIPDNGHYVVPAGGFLLVWADNSPERNSTGHPDLHVSFALNRAGEAIALYAPDGTPIDAVTFGPQQDDVSEGRYPDGDAHIVIQAVPTPGTPNAGPGSIPLIQAWSLDANNSLSLTFYSLPDRHYWIEFKDDLHAPTWTPAHEPIPGTGATLTLQYPIDDSPTTLLPPRYELSRIIPITTRAAPPQPRDTRSAGMLEYWNVGLRNRLKRR
jgi:hypothetical protein